MKAVKFGGTSMACAESIERVCHIVNSDRERRFVVVSAPGKTAGEKKVTDILVSVAHAAESERVREFEPVARRFENICRELGQVDLGEDIAKIVSALPTAEADYIISRGEYLAAKLLAKLLCFDFVDAADIVRFRGGIYDDESTDKLSRDELKNHASAVIPGFYGSDCGGNIVTFSRGGSDVSGAIVARAVGAAVYENFTDVDGFMTCDPNIDSHARTVELLTYRELRELSCMGAGVLHPASIYPLRNAKIPIHLKNTFNNNSDGTLIVPTEEFLSGKYVRACPSAVTAIAGKRHFYALRVAKSMTNTEVGHIRRLLSCFEKLGITVEHIPSGIDCVTVIFSAEERLTNELIETIKAEVSPDNISLTHDLSLIAIVGHGMASRPSAAAHAIDKLTSVGITLRMIDQGASDINIILGVSDKDFDKAMRILNELVISNA